MLQAYYSDDTHIIYLFIYEKLSTSTYLYIKSIFIDVLCIMYQIILDNARTSFFLRNLYMCPLVKHYTMTILLLIQL